MPLQLVEFGGKLYRETIELRREVLRKPLGLDYTAEDLEAERDQIHLAYMRLGRLVGCLVLKIDRGSNLVQMRQVAVRATEQGLGHGTDMVLASIDFIWSYLDLRAMMLHARMPVIPFYERLGFECVGEPYIEVGIEHRTMVHVGYRSFTRDVVERTPGGMRPEKEIAILPLGAIEWHGEHLPLGTDIELANTFARRLAYEVNGVAYPPLWTAMTTLPHRFSLQVGPGTFQAVVRQTVQGLIASGFKKVFIVTGHYAQGQEITLYDLAESLMAQNPGTAILASSPLEILEEDWLLDHAGRFECIQHSWEDSRASLLPPASKGVSKKENAVLGTDPRKWVPSELTILANARIKWNEWAKTLDEQDGIEKLRTYYSRRRQAYAPYVEQYFKGDWQQAIDDWWASQT